MKTEAVSREKKPSPIDRNRKLAVNLGDKRELKVMHTSSVTSRIDNSISVLLSWLVVFWITVSSGDPSMVLTTMPPMFQCGCNEKISNGVGMQAGRLCPEMKFLFE